MSIASEITRISGNIADAYTALDSKGATLPASGSQNSANLADTIDTISAGGGAQTVAEDGWVRPNIFQTVDDVVLSYDETDEFNQWEVLNTGTHDVTHIFGYVLSDYAPSTIYIRVAKNSSCSYQAADGTLSSVSNDSTYSYYSYTFSGDEKWIAFACRYGTSGVSINLSASSTSTTFLDTSSFLSSVMPRYKHVRKLGSQFVMTGIDTDASWNDVCYFLPLYQDYEDFTLTNIKFGGSIEANCYIAMCQRIHDGTKVLSYFTDNSYKTATGTGYFPSNYVDAIGLCNVMPFVIDLSSFSSALTISGDAKVHCRLKKLFIKIPSQNFQFGNTTSAKDVLTKESWEYIATNAPTVSNKTFTVGSHNIAIMGGTSSTAYTTLTGKGWTVS